MAVLGRAALGIWMDVVPEAEDDFDRWYREQHFPERLSVPGFLRGRRYLSAGGTPKYFILYETETADVLRSPAYVARLNNPTDWTRRVLPTMRNVVRNAYRCLDAVGTEDGEGIATLRIEPIPGREEDLRRRYRSEVLPAMARVPGLLTAALYEAEPVATGVITEERKLVGTMAAARPFLCLRGLRDPSVVEGLAWRTLLGPEGPTRHGSARAVAEDTSRLLYSLSRPQP